MSWRRKPYVRAVCAARGCTNPAHGLFLCFKHFTTKERWLLENPGVQRTGWGDSSWCLLETHAYLEANGL